MENTKNRSWELIILDGLAPAKELGCLEAADIDGDGRMEIVVGGVGGLRWYRPATFETGAIAEGGHYHVGMALHDIDGDGLPELFMGEEASPGSERWMVTWYKSDGDIHAPWARYIIDPHFEGGPHDIVFADIDGDGTDELLVIACYTPTPGIFCFKPIEAPAKRWEKHCVARGVFAEGLSAGDVDGDGRMEIVCGPDLYFQPEGGPYAGEWRRMVFAPNFREMCRTALVDITGDGRPDIVIVESEYVDGRVSWYENRLTVSPEEPWVEHPIDEGIYYGHSFNVWLGSERGEVHFFVGEMDQGGCWGPPRNYDPRLLEYSTTDHGRSWKREVLYRGEGTHQAIMVDVDGDGFREVVGKTAGIGWNNPKVQLWRKRREPSFPVIFKHRLLDRQKPYTGMEILAADVDGDGREDVVCGAWWYKNPTWERFIIPGIAQVINAYDLDGDGRQELIAIKGKGLPAADGFYADLNSVLCWLKPVAPTEGKWEEHPIGEGHGDWPHGSVIGPFLPGDRLALVLGYHDAENGHGPEIFEVLSEPGSSPWPKRLLVEIPYGEEMLACDVDGDGKLDIIAGPWWLENLGDGSFKPHRLAPEDFAGARAVVMDVNGDGRPDLIMGEEVMDYPSKTLPFSRLAWFENPADPRSGLWRMHVIDTVRCAHSLGIGDFDGDGVPEIVCGEHDPFLRGRSRCRVYVYKKADPEGKAWLRYTVDDRFEHHDGTKVFEIAPGRLGIISHGWAEGEYVHLWEAVLRR